MTSPESLDPDQEQNSRGGEDRSVEQRKLDVCTSKELSMREASMVLSSAK